MAEQPQPGIALQAVRFVLDVANRRHGLSKLVPVALVLADAVLCALIIWKIPCTLRPQSHVMPRVGKLEQHPMLTCRSG